jgi:Na+-translocating ferredoxin:NAD+ oxidoreductase RNF subunit RnfB
MNTLIISLLAMGGLAVAFALFLLAAYKRFAVVEDPRVAEITESLPGANCGACGFAGCRQYAEAVVKGEAAANRCTPGGSAVVSDIAKIMGMEEMAIEPTVARVLCRGGEQEAGRRSNYRGVETCRAAHFALGGDKTCLYGCLGFGDCTSVCPFDAIHMGPNHLPVVDDETCTACGKCVEECPRGIIEIAPRDQKVFVFCKNRDRGPAAKKACTVACIGCSLCVKNGPEGALEMRDNLAVILDHRAVDAEAENTTGKCPTNAITSL